MNSNQKLGALALWAFTASASATNGMNLEGYGPVATAMGGASFAYQNGAGAMMNNPATLGLMPEGRGIGVALGFLGPDVNSQMPAAGMKAGSGGDAYYMPAFGYVAKQGKLTYGAGIYSQGGMGTEYGANSFMAAGTGRDVRSEVGVGRLILPLAYNVNDQLTIGGSLDWVWATMDIRMAATTSQFFAMSDGFAHLGGDVLAFAGGHAGDNFRLDFSDGSDFSGEAFGSGFAAKLGFVYKISPNLSVGATYHTKTELGDMETDNRAASMSAYTAGTRTQTGALAGKITIHDFQWPETYGIGLAYQPNDRWLIAADYKRLNWSGVMKDFKMTYSTGTGGFGDFTISQDWRDQDIFMIGAAYRMNDKLTLRFGGNFANNPVPNNRVHPMFPATIKNHYMLGFGYVLGPQSVIDFSMTYAPKVSVRGAQAADVPFSGITQNDYLKITHSQFNWQFQYGYFF